MTLKEILDKTTAFFRDKKIETPRLDAELLLAHGLKLDRIQLYLRHDQPMKEEELVQLRDLVRRRAQGEPVAYIVGTKEFFGLPFEVSPAVLIPRPETEHIIEESLAWAKNKKPDLKIIDLGCGSGCIGLTLLKKLPEAQLLAVDLSAAALEVAQRNAKALEVFDRVLFLQADAANENLVMSNFKNFMRQDTIDILVSNPPYIAPTDPSVEENVKKFEPSSALFADEEGLALLKQWSQIYGQHLASEGLMLMEMGMSQGDKMGAHFANLALFNEVRVIKDLSGHDRVIRGVKHG